MLEMELKILQKLDTESQAQYAYRILRKNIMEFDLPPGCLINEGEAAKCLNISRTPIHEAVNRLKDELLVDVVDRAATGVASNLSAVIEVLPHEEKMRVLKVVSALIDR